MRAREVGRVVENARVVVVVRVRRKRRLVVESILGGGVGLLLVWMDEWVCGRIEVVGYWS